MSSTVSVNLSYQDCGVDTPTAVLAVGEVLWDCFPDSRRLGGAPLNFAVHLTRLGDRAALVSAVGADALGALASDEISRLGLDCCVLQVSTGLPTGTAVVELNGANEPRFTIPRPSAYDGVTLAERDMRRLIAWRPKWVYFGTLFGFHPAAEYTLLHLLSALPESRRFCDLNLRTGCFSAELVDEVLTRANVLKLNKGEMEAVGAMLNLPCENIEDFCESGSARFGWDAVAVTLGSAGCAVWTQTGHARAEAVPIQVSDTVGAGDAFSAAFLHGLDRGWPARRMAHFANCVAALVASRPGGIPKWNLHEALALQNKMLRPMADGKKETE